MKLRKLLILPIVLAFFSLLTACVTVAKFEARMDAKKGLNKAQLIEEMGIPDREYTISNFEILEYNQSQTVSSSKSDTSVVNGYLINTRTSVPHTMWCRLEFKLVDDVVESYRYRGDMCRSR
ncbi:hypothetical protein GS19_07615 [Acinetobacter idrijaensis]|nr:hypothetical protein GS19_07615 [Acinetobacter idrijaensis]